MIKCCIFDLDGTLLYTVPSITYHINNTFEKAGLPPITEEDCRRFIGNGASKLIERALRSVGAYSEKTHGRVLEAYNRAYDSDPYYLTEPYLGTAEMIEKLRESGVRLAVLSNKPDSTAKLAVEHFFPNSFDEVMGGRDGVPLKPLPDAARLLLDGLDIAPSETAFIGDSDVDILTGRNAGVALTVGAAWGFRGREELERAGADVITASAEETLSELLRL